MESGQPGGRRHRTHSVFDLDSVDAVKAPVGKPE
jgi:hypothetical protein